MAVRKPRGTPLNLSWLPWDLGGYLYWTPQSGAQAQQRGSLFAPADFTYTYGGANPYTYFDVNLQRFVEVASGSPVVPRDGHFPPARVNTYNTSDPDTNIARGPFAIDGALTDSQVATAANHILETDGGIPATVLRITNTSGASRRIWRQETTDAALSTVWSILAKRTDGGTIDASTLSVGAAALADPLGANLGGTVTYRRVRADGWYQIFAVIPNQASADVFYFVEFADGATVDLEAPQVEALPAGEIVEASPPVLTQATTPEARSVHQLSLTSDFNLPASGWLACTVIPRFDGTSVSLPDGTILEWRVDANNLHRIVIDNANQTIAYEVVETSTQQVFIENQTTDILQGVPLGLVATWGHRGGTLAFTFAQNGAILGTDLAGSIPAGAGTILIGGVSGASPANMQVQSLALGDRVLDALEARCLSVWFRDQARLTLGLTGA